MTSADVPAGRYVPSASDRVRDQVARYEATDGAEGGELNGRAVVILTTTGATSGATRKNPIMRLIHDKDYIAVASFAGAPTDPAWFRNLLAHPDATVQDGAALIAVQAREVHGADKRHLWEVADAANPAYAEYRAKAGRDIPILRLHPTGGDLT